MMQNTEFNNTPLSRLLDRVREMQTVRSGFPAVDPTQKDLMHCLTAAVDRFKANAGKRRTAFNTREAQADAAIIADCLAAIAFNSERPSIGGARA